MDTLTSVVEGKPRRVGLTGEARNQWLKSAEEQGQKRAAERGVDESVDLLEVPGHRHTAEEYRAMGYVELADSLSAEEPSGPDDSGFDDDGSPDDGEDGGW